MSTRATIRVDKDECLRVFSNANDNNNRSLSSAEDNELGAGETNRSTWAGSLAEVAVTVCCAPLVMVATWRLLSFGQTVFNNLLVPNVLHFFR
jgi:hypothetical protein